MQRNKTRRPPRIPASGPGRRPDEDFGAQRVDPPDYGIAAIAGEGPAVGRPLPQGMRARLEQRSGLDLGATRVHYDSERPARFDALATTRGPHIHLAPGAMRSGKYRSYDSDSGALWRPSVRLRVSPRAYQEFRQWEGFGYKVAYLRSPLQGDLNQRGLIDALLPGVRAQLRALVADDQYQQGIDWPNAGQGPFDPPQINDDQLWRIIEGGLRAGKLYHAEKGETGTAPGDDSLDGLLDLKGSWVFWPHAEAQPYTTVSDSKVGRAFEMHYRGHT